MLKKPLSLAFRLRIVPWILILFASISTHAQNKNDLPRKLVIVGDSLTEGYGVAKDKAYPSLLEKKLKDSKLNWEVVNSGISGSTTASAISRIKWVMKSKPNLIMLALGANDGLRGLKPEESKKNLQEAIALIKKEKIPMILAGMMMPPNYGEEYRKAFKTIYSDLAKANDVMFIPFLLEGVGGDPKLNLADGIHPNEKGHTLVAEHVFKSIKWDNLK